MRIGGNILLLLLVCAGLVALQIFLSRSKSRAPGLILPALSFLCSLLSVLGVLFYTFVPEGAAAEPLSALVLPALYLFLLTNIPTIVSLGIYFAVRAKGRKNEQLERMSIQDLE